MDKKNTTLISAATLLELKMGSVHIAGLDEQHVADWGPLNLYTLSAMLYEASQFQKFDDALS